MDERMTFDLDAVRADVEPFTFTLAGETFAMPARGALRWSVWEQLADASTDDTLRELLGDDGYAKLRALDPTKRQLDALAAAYFAYDGGVDEGE